MVARVHLDKKIPSGRSGIRNRLLRKGAIGPLAYRPNGRHWVSWSPKPTRTGLDGPATPRASGTFIDDDGNAHEPFIEAIVAEGITGGCSPAGDRYCPDESVTRGQMATFLARGLG